MFAHAVPPDDRFIVVIVLAFGLAMSFHSSEDLPQLVDESRSFKKVPLGFPPVEISRFLWSCF